MFYSIIYRLRIPDKPKCSTHRLPCDFFDDFDLFEAPLRSIVTGIGDAYPCSASAKNTTVFTRSAAAVAAAAEDSTTGGGGGIHGGWVNLPLSRLSRYSAACNKAAILMFDDDVGRRRSRRQREREMGVARTRKSGRRERGNSRDALSQRFRDRNKHCIITYTARRA